MGEHTAYPGPVTPTDLDAAALGGRRGAHAPHRSPRQRLIPIAALAALPVIAALLRQAHCLDHGWQGRGPLWRMCQSDLGQAFTSQDLGRGLPAYLSGDIVLDQPLGSGAAMSLLGGLTPDLGPLTSARLYVITWALLATACTITLVWLVGTMRGRAPAADPTQVALAPVIALAVLHGPSILAVTAATAALWFWQRHQPGRAGVAAGIAILISPYAVLLPIAVLLTLPADSTRRQQLRRAAGTLAGTLVAALAISMTVNPDLITGPVESWASAPPGTGSPWLIPSMAGVSLPGPIATGLALLGVSIAIALGRALLRLAARPVTSAEVALVMVAVVLATSTSLPPEASLWLVPLAALSGLPWRDVLIWAAAEAAHLVAMYLYLGGLEVADEGLPAPWYTLFLLARLLGIGYLAWRVWDSALWATARVQPDPEAFGSGLGGVPEPSWRHASTAHE